MTLFGVIGRPGAVAFGRTTRNFDATRRDATERERLLSGDFCTRSETLTELDCPDATLRLKITELGATRD
jgi:hypothetical protein